MQNTSCSDEQTIVMHESMSWGDFQLSALLEGSFHNTRRDFIYKNKGGKHTIKKPKQTPKPVYCTVD